MIACGALVCPNVTSPNASESGEAETFGVAGATPVPLMLTCAGDPPAKLNAIFAVSAPVAVGV